MGAHGITMMRVHVNGEQRTVAAGVTVAGLLTELDIRPERVAVELNLNILDRGEFERRSLQEGDRVEIIGFIGGGAGQGGSWPTIG
jgi:thiamine biosynthesis protein ThiS